MSITTTKLFITLLSFTLLTITVISSDPTVTSPAPAPHLGTSADSSPPLPPPSHSPASSDLPPAPTPSDNKPQSHTPAPTPEAADAADVKSEEHNNGSKSGGMSGGKKAGIAIGVIAAACVVGFGGVLYKKRQQNIRRAEFSSAARREFL